MANLQNTTINDTGFLQLPAGNISQRPTPQQGMIRISTDAQDLDIYNGTTWTSAKGSSQDNPAISAKEAYASGLRGTTAWILIAGKAYQMEYDPSDRYSTGEPGWVNYTNTFFGNNHTTISSLEYGNIGTIRSSWDGNSPTNVNGATIATGSMRIGRNLSHIGGLSLGTIRVALPSLTAARYFATDAEGGGEDAADFGTGWQAGQNFNAIVNNIPYQNNGSGYFMTIWSGNLAGTWSNDLLIMDDGAANQGFGGNRNGAFTVTSVVRRFATQTKPTVTPYAIWGTVDAFREYAYYRAWNIWIH